MCVLYTITPWRTNKHTINQVGTVLQYPICYGRDTVRNLAYPVQLSGPGVFNIPRYKQHFGSVLFTHFLVVPFFALVVISISCAFYATAGEESARLEMHFFCQNKRMFHFMDGHGRGNPGQYKAILL